MQELSDHTRTDGSLPEKTRIQKGNQLGISEVAYKKRILEGKELERLTGWPWPAGEVTHFLGTPKHFTGDLKRWRKQLISRIHDGELPCDPDLIGSDLKRIQERVDEYIGLLREVARILALLHGSPDLGNKPDPVDELVYIILSRKTRESAYQDDAEVTT